eukprot:scpid5245/ scgid15101/ 
MEIGAVQHMLEVIHRNRENPQPTQDCRENQRAHYKYCPMLQCVHLGELVCVYQPNHNTTAAKHLDCASSGEVKWQKLRSARICTMAIQKNVSSREADAHARQRQSRTLTGC